RPGGIAARDIEAVAGIEVIRGATGIQAPGMLASHYAPRASMRLNVGKLTSGEALLAFGRARAEGWQDAVALRNLSEAGNLREAAANLFAYMQALDRSGAPTIAVEPIPADGLGEAINDRLARAAAPRDKID
ncbi:MAG: translation factor Sua5, partial [Mesorhizobium sp.]